MSNSFQPGNEFKQPGGRPPHPANWWEKIPEVEPIQSPQIPPQVWPVGQPTTPGIWPAPTPAPVPEVIESLTDICWQCGQLVCRGDVYCRWCAAQLQVAAVAPVAVPVPYHLAPPRTWSLRALIAVVVGYLLVLAVVIVSAVILVLRMQAMGLDWNSGSWLPRDIEKLATLLLEQMLIAGIGSSLSVLATWIAAGSIRSLPRPDGNNRALAWVLGPLLVLPALLALNLVYSHLVQKLVGENELESEIMRELSRTYLFWVLITVQPAIFEELLFRYLMLGTLYDALKGAGRHLAMHMAILLSSIMFAIAHLGQPLHIPYFILVGLALGYLRLASGGLALPMLLHFLHNGTVLVIAWLTQ